MLLFCYEYKFLLQIVDTAQHLYDKGILPPILYMMQLTKRYIDDIGTLYSSIMRRHLYNDRSDKETHLVGIYPPFLKITTSHTDRDARSGSVPFLDVLIRPNDTGSSLETLLFDKREHYPLSTMGITFIKFPHISSLLASNCKYNVLTGQLHRFVSRISNYEDFISRCTGLLIYLTQTKGYYPQRLFNTLWRTLECLQDRLFVGRPGSSPFQIYREIHVRYLRAVPSAAAVIKTRPSRALLQKRQVRPRGGPAVAP